MSVNRYLVRGRTGNLTANVQGNSRTRVSDRSIVFMTWGIGETESKVGTPGLSRQGELWLLMPVAETLAELERSETDMEAAQRFRHAETVIRARSKSKIQPCMQDMMLV